MRKVIYQVNSLSEPMPGFFHCWAGTMENAYAIIEDTTTGKMHRVNDDMFRFVTPPGILLDILNSFKKEYQYVKPCPECQGGYTHHEGVCKVCNDKGIIASGDPLTVRHTEENVLPYLNGNICFFPSAKFINEATGMECLRILMQINKKLAPL